MASGRISDNYNTTENTITANNRASECACVATNGREPFCLISGFLRMDRQIAFKVNNY